MGGEALSTGLRLPSTTPPASHWLSPGRHESRAFPAKQPLQSELLTALGLRCLQGRGRGVRVGVEEEELQRPPRARRVQPAPRASRVTRATEPALLRLLRAPTEVGCEWEWRLGGDGEAR